VTPETSVILPTYDEPDTAPEVINALDAHLNDYEVVVMDDSPTSETADAIRSQTDPKRVVVHRRTQGSDLSQAILDGVQHARGRRLVVMDADGQHPPETVPDLVAALDTVDMAFGSRHDAGGTNRADWTPKRYLMSFGASVIAWLAVPDARPVQDPMSGFFGIRRAVVDGVADRLQPRGYKIGLELLARCPVDSVAEVPVTFTARAAGESNTDWRQNLRYLRHMVRLAKASRRRPRPRRTTLPEEADA